MKILRAVKFREKQSSPVVSRGWKGTGELVFNDKLMQDEFQKREFQKNIYFCFIDYA